MLLLEWIGRAVEICVGAFVMLWLLWLQRFLIGAHLWVSSGRRIIMMMLQLWLRFCASSCDVLLLHLSLEAIGRGSSAHSWTTFSSCSLGGHPFIHELAWVDWLWLLLLSRRRLPHDYLLFILLPIRATPLCIEFLSQTYWISDILPC